MSTERKRFLSNETESHRRYDGSFAHKTKKAVVAVNSKPTAVIYGPNNDQVQNTVNFLLNRIGGACRIKHPEETELQKAQTLIMDIRELTGSLEEQLTLACKTKNTPAANIARVERVKGLDPDNDFLSKIFLYFSASKANFLRGDNWLEKITHDWRDWRMSDRFIRWLCADQNDRNFPHTDSQKAAKHFLARVAKMHQQLLALNPHQLATLDDKEHALLFDFLRFYQLQTYDTSMGEVIGSISEESSTLKKRIAELKSQSEEEENETKALKKKASDAWDRKHGSSEGYAGTHIYAHCWF